MGVANENCIDNLWVHVVPEIFIDKFLIEKGLWFVHYSLHVDENVWCRASNTYASVVNVLFTFTVVAITIIEYVYFCRLVFL